MALCDDCLDAFLSFVRRSDPDLDTDDLVEPNTEL